MGKDSDLVKLTDNNFVRWKNDISVHLKKKRLWSIVDGSRTPKIVSSESGDQAGEDEDFVTDSYAALEIILRSLSDKYHNYVVGMDCPKAAWEKLMAMLSKSSALNVNNLAREYQQIEFDGDVSLYFAKLRQSI